MYCSASIIRIIKSRRMKWAGHAARIEEKRSTYGFWWEIRKERDSQEGLDVGGRIILEWILER
jgi:hypothetical protein